tara:strand:+ start:414 stop:929 length:516 start_codon:yes stop_codon:yes gene_type:complete
MCAPFGEDPSFIKGNWRETWSQHKVQEWDKWVAEKRAEMKEKGWDPKDPKNYHPASGFTTQVARWQWSKKYDDKYNTPGQGVHASGTGRQLDDPSVTAPQAGAAASGRDQNLGAGGGTNPQSNQNNPDTNTNQSNKDKAGSKKASKKENLKIPKPDVNLPNGNQSSGGVNY